MGWRDAPEVGGWRSAPEEAAGDNLPDSRLGRNVAAAQVFMGERGQEIWDALRKGTYGTGAILAQLLPDRLRERVTLEMGRRSDAVDRETAGAKAPMKALEGEFPVASVVGPLAVDVGFPMGRATKGAGVLRQAAEMAVPGMIPGALTAENQLENAAASGVLTGAGSLVLGGAAKLLRPVERGAPSAAVQAADALGYELPAGVRTGSEKLQALEAALEGLPGTKPVMAGMRARNAAITEGTVEKALAAAGGEMDAGNAGASAVRGYREGVKRVLDESGQEYERLLDGREVDLAGNVRGAAMEVVEGGKALPATERGAKAMEAAQELLGSPGYKAPDAPKPRSRVVDTQKDDLITAIRKKGGLDYTEFGELADQITFGKSFDGPVYRGTDRYGRPQGVSRDRMAEYMWNEGFIPEPDPELLVDAMERAARGEKIMSSAFEPKPIDPLADAVTALVDRLDSKSVPKQSPGFLRTNPEVPGQTAQRIRSSYSAKAQAAHGAGKLEDARGFERLRDAVDSAIEKTIEGLPDVEKGAFASARERYGLAKAIESLTPENQGEFLAKLYRGAKSPDQFYSWLGITDDAGFSDVSRGYLTQLIERAKDRNGELSGKALARVLRGADPEALRVLGGESGKTLSRVAEAAPAAEFAFPSSGTSERSFMQRMVTNPLAVYGLTAAGGAGLGAGAGGSEGAMAGALAGLAMPRTAQALLFSRMGQRYLTDGLVRLSPAERAAISRVGGLAGLALASGARE